MEKDIIIEYSSNNSGGDWWLSDEDWKNLEKAGWYVVYGDFIYENGNSVLNEEGFPKYTKGFSIEEYGRYLGAIATYAYRKGLSLDDAISEFEKITGQDAEAEGCDCCGKPHNFSQFN